MTFKQTIGLLLLILVGIATGCASFQTKFGALAYDLLPEETALDKAYQYDGKVIIVGAGASGLAAASILEKNNIDYQIIEATDRYGGRVKKVEGFAEFPIDIGAEWIHNRAAILNRLKGKEGDEIDEALFPYQLESSAVWDGEKLKEVPQSELDAYFKGFPEYKFKNSTWYDYVDNNLAQLVKHKIRYNAPVTAVDYSASQVKLTLRSGEDLSADKVLMTVSVGVLKSGAISFLPELPQQKTDAIASVTFLPGFKMIMKFSENFYPNVISCKEKGSTKDFYDAAFKKDSEDNVLGLLSIGSSARYYYGLGDEKAILKDVLAELDKMYDGKASRTFTGQYLLEDWGRHEFTQGTWASSLLGKSKIEALNSPLNGQVYFAGDAYDTYRQGGVPGTILSGYRAIDLRLSQVD